jgi:arginine N-succinyltransferase
MSFIIRPVTMEDLEAVLDLAAQTGPGMTSLPADGNLLSEKIQDSINSLAIKPTKVGNQSYRFVMEHADSAGSRLVGICAIRDRIGGFEPFYSYKIQRARHQSTELGVDLEVPYLELCKEYDGPSIISSLFLLPEFRKQGLGQYLSQARFLFMADFPERFTETVIAEMRGVIDADNKSPFWEGTVRHFFDMDFDRADYLSFKDKGFIADLMPKYPIYIPLLPESVIQVIGQVHHKTKPALKFLESQGFTRDGHVDIFDAGPRISAKISEIKTVSCSKKTKLIKTVSSETANSFETIALVSNAKMDFRVALARISVQEEGLIIDDKSAKKLGLILEEELRFLEI